MEDTKANTTNGSKVVGKIGSTAGAVNLRAQHSQAAPAKETDSDEYALEILQQSAREVGARGISIRSWNSEYNGKAVIMIAVFDSRICGICGLWHSDAKECGKVAA